jgi:hypothetical protein
MNDGTTASDDAINACDLKDTVLWLRPRSAVEQASDNAGARETFRQVTASLGLGALLTLGSAGSALGPALASSAEHFEIAAPAEGGVEVSRAEPVMPLPVESEIVVPLPEPADVPLIVLAETRVNSPAAEPSLSVQFDSFRPAELHPTVELAASPVQASAEPVRAEAPALRNREAETAAIATTRPATAAVTVPGDAPAALPLAAATVPGDAPAAPPAGPEATAPDEGSSTLVTAAAQPGENSVEAEPGNDPQELLQFDDMRVPRWIVETILKASEVTGVDPVYMMALADKESSFIPANKASGSSAEGLFQFLSATWLEVVRSFGAKHGLVAEAAAIKRKAGKLSIPDAAMREHVLGLRRDPYLSALMAAEMMKRDRERVERRLGRPISRSEFYLAHFFGVNSASKFMALLDGKPKQSAPRVFPAAARANRTLFFAKKGRKTRHLSVAEVYSKIDGMIDKRLDRYEGVMTAVSDASF